MTISDDVNDERRFSEERGEGRKPVTSSGSKSVDLDDCSL